MPRTCSLPIALCALLVAFNSNATATWSIVLVDEATGEIGLGTVTCLEGLDLLAFTPAVVVGKGAACAQASGDFDGVRRQIIFDGLSNDTPLAQIFDQLDDQQFHARVQYGIVSVYDGALTYTGDEAQPWAGGVVGQIETVRYAIQGNVLAGPCVIPAIESAMLGLTGDLPLMLMSAMAAAREAGGDGRCSCSLADPDGCICPPPFFTKAGHVGGMVVARIGDADDTDCTYQGCADGDYYLRLNAGSLFFEDPDPVVILQSDFDAWRTDLTGRPDAIRSIVEVDSSVLPPNGVATTTMTIDLMDWQGLPIDAPVRSVTVEHAPGSAGLTSIGPVTAVDESTYTLVLTAGTELGEDRFTITVDDGVRPVRLMPDPIFSYTELGDVNGDGAVGFGDLNLIVFSWGQCASPPASCSTDLNGDGVVSLFDLFVVLSNWD